MKEDILSFLLQEKKKEDLASFIFELLLLLNKGFTAEIISCCLCEIAPFKGVVVSCQNILSWFN